MTTRWAWTKRRKSIRALLQEPGETETNTPEKLIAWQRRNYEKAAAEQGWRPSESELACAVADFACDVMAVAARIGTQTKATA